jgi:hypothetical protein
LLGYLFCGGQLFTEFVDGFLLLTDFRIEILRGFLRRLGADAFFLFEKLLASGKFCVLTCLVRL